MPRSEMPIVCATPTPTPLGTGTCALDNVTGISQTSVQHSAFCVLMHSSISRLVQPAREMPWSEMPIVCATPTPTPRGTG
eukprot:4070008-Prymnesium_polylepis.1